MCRKIKERHTYLVITKNHLGLAKWLEDFYNKYYISSKVMPFNEAILTKWYDEKHKYVSLETYDYDHGIAEDYIFINGNKKFCFNKKYSNGNFIVIDEEYLTTIHALEVRNRWEQNSEAS